MKQAKALLGLGGLAFLKSRADSQVGHFISEKGEEEFRVVYHEAMALLPRPEETKDVATEYGTVRVYWFTKEDNRHKEPIMLVPGRSASTPMWKPNLEGLLKERPVYSIDLLGEPGMSVQMRPIKNREDQAKWLSQVLLELDLERVHIVADSFGGWTAMNLARFYPERVASLSLLEPVFVFAPISLKLIAVSIPATVPIVPHSLRRKMLSYISGGAEIDDSDPGVRLIATGMRTFKIRLPAPQQFNRQDLVSIGPPVLALMAGKSTMHNSAKAVENGKKYVKDIEIESWPHASHAINGEYPEEVNSRILEFVRKHATS